MEKNQFTVTELRKLDLAGLKHLESETRRYLAKDRLEIYKEQSRAASDSRFYKKAIARIKTLHREKSGVNNV